MSRRKPGDPIGPKQTITRAQIAAELGLRPGSAPREAKPKQLTPAQARLKMSDKYVGEGPDIGWEEITVSGGRDVAAALGVDLATLPVGVEAELGKPEPRPERRPESVTTTADTPPLTEADADELRQAYRAHAAKVKAIAEAARGDAVKEARAAEEVRASAALGEALKAKLGGKL